MILGKIIGNVVSTVTESGYGSRKILIVQPIDPSGQPKGQSFLAIDTVQSGMGDTVLVLEEGGSARMILGEPETFTIKAIIAGVVDHITV
ncbi:MAG: EutN/CcmL family microcompartment protein [Bacteroidales bacterium]|nr:EutN/CcmL family microcompartment protein [Bacteroidales bacterium]